LLFLVMALSSCLIFFLTLSCAYLGHTKLTVEVVGNTTLPKIPDSENTLASFALIGEMAQFTLSRPEYYDGAPDYFLNKTFFKNVGEPSSFASLQINLSLDQVLAAQNKRSREQEVKRREGYATYVSSFKVGAEGYYIFTDVEIDPGDDSLVLVKCNLMDFSCDDKNVVIDTDWDLYTEWTSVHPIFDAEDPSKVNYFVYFGAFPGFNIYDVATQKVTHQLVPGLVTAPLTVDVSLAGLSITYPVDGRVVPEFLFNES